MAKLNIQAIARKRRVSIAKIQRVTELPLTTVRKLWHSSRTGLKRDEGTIDRVKLSDLQAVADGFGINICELIAQEN